MLTYQCKCCGAELDVKLGMTVCRCNYCNVMQTLPLLSFDEKAILWTRAEELRRSGEYDRASQLYTQLIELDNSDPDIFWALVLCHYGIEYVEEPCSHKRTPTINRIQYRSVIDDENYHTAIKLANGDQQRIYIIQAQQIETLRKDIIAVSLTEKPYDVFICYKETDATGRRTEDSVLASQIYRALTAEGWRVFFSRVTLEDKAGTAYEPYIFGALNSAKLMLVVGTSPENFNAVWVKNEWNRYLGRIAENGDGTLAVLYKNMLPEHLPEEFAHLQTYDMSTNGFIDDLLHGARKLLVSKAENISEIESAPTQVDEFDADALLRRAELFLEDGDYSAADKYCERVLDMRPENTEAYLIKLMAEFKVSSLEKLAEVNYDITLSGNYKKAIRFGDEQLRSTLEEYRNRALYTRYSKELDAAIYEQQCLAIAERFKTLDGYSDSTEKVSESLEKAESIKNTALLAKKEQSYTEAYNILSADEHSDKLAWAEKQLRILGDYKNSSQLAEECAQKLQMIRESQEKLEAQRAAELEHQNKKNEKTKQLVKKTAIIGTVAAAVVITGAIGINAAVNTSRYNHAVELRDNGRYDEAISAFVELSGYSDSSEQIMLTRYQKASALLNDNKYDEAAEAFQRLKGYSDSEEKFYEAKYLLAAELTANGSYDEAISTYRSIESYKDSTECIDAINYSIAVSLRDNGNYSEAADKFNALGNYSDSAEQYLSCCYFYAKQLADNKSYNEAIAVFKELGTYLDSAESVLRTQYDAAQYYVENKKYSDAISAYETLGDYSDSAVKLKEAKYLYSIYCIETQNYEQAIKLLKELNYSGYSNSKQLMDEAKYKYALELAENQKYDPAIELLLSCEHENAAEALLQTRYDYGMYLFENKKYDEAVELFEQLSDYSNSKEMIEAIEHQKFLDSKPGEYISFGNYEQNGISADGAEPIEWLVIDRKGDSILVISKDCIELMEFGAQSWINSPVRNWLNNDFFNCAFSAVEMRLIKTTTVMNDDNIYAGEFCGDDTEDKLFLLSKDEVAQYFPHKEDRISYRSEYVQNKIIDLQAHRYGADIVLTINPDEPSDWWLRSIAGYEKIDCIKRNTGEHSTNRLSREHVAVRPAMWIDLTQGE